MWVRSQDRKEIVKVDNLYTHNGYVVSTWVGEAAVELGRYKSTKEVDKALNDFWSSIANGCNIFEMSQ